MALVDLREKHYGWSESAGFFNVATPSPHDPDLLAFDFQNLIAAVTTNCDFVFAGR